MVGVMPACELMCVTSRVAGCGWDKWGCGQRWLSEVAGFSAAAFVWNWRGFRCQRLQISDPTDPIQAAQSSGETSVTARRMSAGVNIRLPVYLYCTGRRQVVFRCLWMFVSSFIYLAFLFSVFYSWSFCSSASVNPSVIQSKGHVLQVASWAPLKNVLVESWACIATLLDLFLHQPSCKWKQSLFVCEDKEEEWENAPAAALRMMRMNSHVWWKILLCSAKDVQAFLLRCPNGPPQIATDVSSSLCVQLTLLL